MLTVETLHANDKGDSENVSLKWKTILITDFLSFFSFYFSVGFYANIFPI